MRKILSLLLTILMIFLLVSCGNKKTTIDSKEEWEALFNIDNYSKIKVVEHNTGNEEDYGLNITRDNNIVTMEVKYDGVVERTYFELDEENNSINNYSTVAKDVYCLTKEKYDDSNELNEEFRSCCSAYLFYADFSDQYENIEHDEERECYYFDYSFDESYNVMIEIYPVNGLISKQVITYDDGGSTVLVYEELNESIKLPSINNEVKNKDEWAKLFTKEKYSNCISYDYDSKGEHLTYIQDNIINRNEYILENDSYSSQYYIYDLDTNKETVLIAKEDGTFEEGSPTYNNEIKCFDDRFINYTIGEEYTNDFDSLTKVDDHYELNKNNKIIEFYISGGYIYMMNITDLATNEIKEIQIYSYGTTIISDPRNQNVNQE